MGRPTVAAAGDALAALRGIPPCRRFRAPCHSGGHRRLDWSFAQSDRGTAATSLDPRAGARATGPGGHHMDGQRQTPDSSANRTNSNATSRADPPAARSARAPAEPRPARPAEIAEPPSHPRRFTHRRDDCRNPLPGTPPQWSSRSTPRVDGHRIRTEGDVTMGSDSESSTDKVKGKIGSSSAGTQRSYRARTRTPISSTPRP